MEKDNWGRLKELFQEALELAPEEREAYLDDACRGSEDVRSEVEKMLAAHDGGGQLLQSPTVSVAGTVDPTEAVGTTIGRYKILQSVGEGGFGSVYMAEQEKPVRRKVALKIIKLGMDTKQVIARFEAERQALALMDHPNIARVFDAGATETGRPYFVMELVRGIPITEYCDQNNLTAHERLELFQSVCSAVQHAHQKGIIHRDIKPSNVMVTLHDGVPVPKVIDFGIAKATNQKLTEKTLFTEYHQFVGTPQYMSPEQAEMSGLDVDTRTDIYALGVLLYELLTGTTPFDPDRLRGLAYSEIHRVIREEEPDKPSTRVSTLGRIATDTAKHRATDIAALRKALSGDLDWIVMKAIEKDRTRRYDTANSLRLDVGRYLGNEPVMASPPSAAYRARKFLRRNRVAVGVFGTVSAALLLGTGLATFGLLEARSERSAARAEAESARAINEFFTDMLASVDPHQARLLSVFAPESGVVTATRAGFDRNVSVVEMLKRAGDRVEDAFHDKPLLEAEVRETLGLTLFGLGQPGAGPHVAKAAELRRGILPEDHPDRIRSEFEIALGSFDADRVREARDAFERVYGPDHPKTLSATSHLADVMTVDRRISSTPSQGPSRFAAASDLYRETLEKQRRILGDEHRDVLKTLLGWGGWYSWGARGEEAEELIREAYETAQRTLSPDDALTLKAAAMLGWALNFQGRYEEGEKYLREVIDKQDRVLGPDHPDSNMGRVGLGRSLNRPEDLDEKEELWRRSIARGQGGAVNWVVSRDLAFFLVRRGKLDDGIQVMRESYEACLKVMGERNSITTGAEANLVRVLRAAGRHDEARGVVKARLDSLRRRAEKDDATADDLNEYAWELLTVWPTDLRQPRTAARWAEKAIQRAAPEDSAPILDSLARALQLNGDLTGAIARQTEAVEVERAREAADVAGYVVDLVRYLTLAGDGAAAMEETQRQTRAMREDAETAPEDLAAKLRGFGRRLNEYGLWGPAEVPLIAGLSLYQESPADDTEDHIQSMLELSEAYLGQGKTEEATDLLARAEELSSDTRGAESAEHVSFLREVAKLLSSHRRYAEAVPFFRQAIEILTLLGDEKKWARRATELSFTYTLARLGQTEESAHIARDLIDVYREERGDSYHRTGWARFELALTRIEAGDHAAAEPELSQALEILRRNRQETRAPVWFAAVEAALAECLTVRGLFEEAELLLSQAYERVREYGKDEPWAHAEVLDRLVALYEAWGKPSEAARWRDLSRL